jgi:hypothetical protein
MVQCYEAKRPTFWKLLADHIPKECTDLLQPPPKKRQETEKEKEKAVALANKTAKRTTASVMRCALGNGIFRPTEA